MPRLPTILEGPQNYYGRELLGNPSNAQQSYLAGSQETYGDGTGVNARRPCTCGGRSRISYGYGRGGSAQAQYIGSGSATYADGNRREAQGISDSHGYIGPGNGRSANVPGQYVVGGSTNLANQSGASVQGNYSEGRNPIAYYGRRNDESMYMSQTHPRDQRHERNRNRRNERRQGDHRSQTGYNDGSYSSEQRCQTCGGIVQRSSSGGLVNYGDGE